MSQLDDLLRDLVVANRILSHEDVVDAYGHISVRHPDNPKRFFMSRSRAPELVEHSDLIEFDQEGEPIKDKRQPYLERFIHAAIFEARPDVMSVVHAHAEDTLPFGMGVDRSEEHTSELQSLRHLVCRLLLEKKK